MTLYIISFIIVNFYSLRLLDIFFQTSCCLFASLCDRTPLLFLDAELQWSAQIMVFLKSGCSWISSVCWCTSRFACLKSCYRSDCFRTRCPSSPRGAMSSSRTLSRTKMNALGPLLLVDLARLESRNVAAVLRNATASSSFRYPMHHLRKIPV